MELLSQRARLHLSGTGQTRWLQETEGRVDALLKSQELTLVHPIHGGLSSIVLLVEDQTGERQVAKIMPPEEQTRQAAVLQAMQGKGVPRLLSQNPGIIILEYLEGQARPETVKTPEVIKLIGQWDAPAPEAAGPIAKQLKRWLQAARPEKGERKDIQKAVSQAAKLLKELPQSQKLLHGDLGQHNLIQGTELWAIDPTGTAGPIEADIGFMSFLWPGSPPPAEVNRLIEILCQALRADPDTARGYAIVRASCSAGFGNNRNEPDFTERSLAVIEELS